jgi:hypothetical protein
LYHEVGEDDDPDGSPAPDDPDESSPDDELPVASTHPLDADESELHGPSSFQFADDWGPSVSSDEPLGDAVENEYGSELELGE